MSAIAFAGAIEVGLIYALVALGVLITFRILNFPDLTVDGSFPLGASVAAVAIVHGLSPWIATALALVAGAGAGWLTALLSVRFNILNLLASILTMSALFSINLRIMGAPNVALLNKDTILSGVQTWPMRSWIAVPLAIAFGVVVVTLLLIRFMKSEFGLAMRATGANPRMARAQGVSTKLYIYVGLALSNALVALGGALFAQTNGFADVSLGTGTIIVGLAAVIVGENLVRSSGIVGMIIGAVIGSLLYRLAVALALNSSWIGLTAADLNIVTATLVAIALIIPQWRSGGAVARLRRKFGRGALAGQESR